ncbi:MAG: hypothetical protein QOE65_1907 [Solirubrobacteraceae bacterium]|jgi:hypothetical protein|nr:hypothetical protein [Solirubrobacteraceae bacterium]
MTERSLGEWLRLVRDGWPALVVCVALGVGGALFYTSRQDSSYGATCTLVVSAARGFLDPQDADQLPALADTVGRLVVTAPVVHQTAVRYVRATSDPAEAARRRRTATAKWIKAHVVTRREASSAILRVSGSARSQREASDLAEAAGLSLSGVVNQRSAAPQATPGGLRVAAFPASGDGKLSPRPRRDLLIGANVGILAGLLAAYLMGVLRRRLWRPEEIEEELHAPVLGRLVRVGGEATVVGPEFAELPDRLAGGPARGGPLTVLVSGTGKPEAIRAVARSTVQALEAMGGQARLVENGGSSEESEAPDDTPTPVGGYIVVAGPPVGKAGNGLLELAREADHTLIVTALGTSRRKLRRVHGAGRVFERRLLGTVVTE